MFSEAETPEDFQAMKDRRRHGFSLIELLVVVAIIGALAARRFRKAIISAGGDLTKGLHLAYINPRVATRGLCRRF